MLKAMYDNNINIEAAEDANVYNALAGNRDFVISGYAQELQCSVVGFQATLSIGMGLIQGRFVHENGIGGTATTMVPQDMTSGFFVIRYDVSQPLGLEAQFRVVATPLLQDLRNGGISRDLVLSHFRNLNGVITLTDVREFSGNRAKNDTVELLENAWTSSGLTFVQTISTDIVFEDSNIIPDVVLSGSVEDQLEQINQFGLISTGTVGDGTLTFICLEEKPTIDLTVKMLIMGGV